MFGNYSVVLNFVIRSDPSISSVGISAALFSTFGTAPPKKGGGSRSSGSTATKANKRGLKREVKGGGKIMRQFRKLEFEE
jgi:hypothetical protein